MWSTPTVGWKWITILVWVWRNSISQLSLEDNLILMPHLKTRQIHSKKIGKPHKNRFCLSFLKPPDLPAHFSAVLHWIFLRPIPRGHAALVLFLFTPRDKAHTAHKRYVIKVVAYCNNIATWKLQEARPPGMSEIKRSFNDEFPGDQFCRSHTPACRADAVPTVTDGWGDQGVGLNLLVRYSILSWLRIEYLIISESVIPISLWIWWKSSTARAGPLVSFLWAPYQGWGISSGRIRRATPSALASFRECQSGIFQSAMMKSQQISMRHPQPLLIWPESAVDQMDIYISFDTTRYDPHLQLLNGFESSALIPFGNNSQIRGPCQECPRQVLCQRSVQPQGFWMLWSHQRLHIAISSIAWPAASHRHAYTPCCRHRLERLMLDELRSFSRSFCLFGSIIVAGVYPPESRWFEGWVVCKILQYNWQWFPSKTLVTISSYRMDFRQESQWPQVISLFLLHPTWPIFLKLQQWILTRSPTYLPASIWPQAIQQCWWLPSSSETDRKRGSLVKASDRGLSNDYTSWILLTYGDVLIRTVNNGRTLYLCKVPCR